jgi:peptidoglycan-associated lipoprotein
MLRISLILIVTLSFLSVVACRSKSKTMGNGLTADNSNISEPEPREPKATAQEDLIENKLKDITNQLQPIFFDYDKATIRADQVSAVQNNATVLKKYLEANLVLEGHCDERGTEEYNLALGERRAKAAKDYLMDLGVDEKRIKTISYGESRPFAYEHNENAWQQNRRGQPMAVIRADEEKSNQ